MKNYLADIAKAGREIIGLSNARGQSGEFEKRFHELLKLRGEASAIALADDLLERFFQLNSQAQQEFFVVLLEQLLPDSERIQQAIEHWQADPSPDTIMRLSCAASSPRIDLLRVLNTAPGGTEKLVRMREILLGLLRKQPRLLPIDKDFSHVFQSWFNRGFLRLERIDWETPAFILEKLIAFEAVHEIAGWDDLRRRLAKDRRCFAFFHPALPDEPLIFVQVALVKGMSDNINAVLSSEAGDDEDADTAIFYSISNCQRGLQGVSFGNFLIKQVAGMLAQELPGLKQYATLSPIPGFARWLRHAVGENQELPIKKAEHALLETLLESGWREDTQLAKKLRPLARKLCAHYFLHEKKGEEPLDPVARFHLRNGARLDRINWLADASEKGLTESFGMMVNYVYDPKAVLRNHEAFVNKGEIIASSAVRSLTS